MWKWVATLDVQDLYQWMLQSRMHIVTVNEIRGRIRHGQRCVDNIIECGQG